MVVEQTTYGERSYDIYSRLLKDRKEREAETKAWVPNMSLAGTSIRLCPTCQPGNITSSYRGNLPVTCLWPRGQSE